MWFVYVTRFGKLDDSSFSALIQMYSGGGVDSVNQALIMFGPLSPIAVNGHTAYFQKSEDKRLPIHFAQGVWDYPVVCHTFANKAGRAAKPPDVID